jgi:hypothetical protein
VEERGLQPDAGKYGQENEVLDEGKGVPWWQAAFNK